MKKALILGATGNFGRAQALALLEQGYHLNLLLRDPNKLSDAVMMGHEKVTIYKGDAMEMDDLLMAGQDCEVIIHGVNVPYNKWETLMPKITQNVMNAAKTLNATILFAGNIYNFAPNDGPIYDEQSPQQPITKKGAFRKRLEQDMAHFAQTQGVQIIVLRGGDYLGPNSSESSMFKYLVLDNLPKGKMLLAGRKDKKHVWTYLPDLGQIGAKLMSHRSELGLFEVFHHQGFDLTGQELVNAVERAAEKPLKVGKMPWGLIRIIGIFNKALGEMMELKFMSNVAQSLSQNKLQALLGQVPATPLDEALRTTFKAHNVV